jgi:alpha-mannosidase
MDQYVAHRPGPHEMEMPSHVLRWRSPDGSEVLFSRILRAYQTTYSLIDVKGNLKENVVDAEAMWERMLEVDELASDDCDSAMLFFGVGNHGGGPTIENLKSIRQIKEQHPELNICISDTIDFFDDQRQRYEEIPVLDNDLQHHAAGCYSAVSAIKKGVRQAENALYAAENYALLAHNVMGKTVPGTGEFSRAWKNVLFAHFHDAMGGCSAKSVYDDEDIFLKETLAFAQRTENNMLQSLSWKIHTADSSKGIPVLVFNPHPFEIQPLVTVPKRIEQLFDDEGNEIPSQIVRSEDSRCRKKLGSTVFKAKVPALGWATYWFRGAIPQQGFTPYYYPDTSVKPEYENKAWVEALPSGSEYVKDRELVLENELLRVQFQKHTGYITSILDKTTGKEQLSGLGAVPVVMDEYGFDTWAHAQTYWDKQVGQFMDAEISTLERGPVRSCIKVVSHYGKSTLTQYFSLYAGSPSLEVSCKLDWNEQHKMLKLRFDSACTEDPHAFYEIPFGVFERPANGEEEPGQSWIAVKQGNEGLALLNDSKYSYSIKDNQLNLSVCRSPYYIDHARGDQDDLESEFTDQGEQTFRYAVLPLEGRSWGQVTREARLLNQDVTVIMENNHEGSLPTALEGLKCDQENLIVTAFKRSEDGKGTVLRAYETEGRQVEATFTGAALPAPLSAVWKPWSVQTYYLPDGETAWTEVLLTEFDM